MFVGTTEAVNLLAATAQRVRLLLKQGRLQGAKKIARAWIIPLFKASTERSLLE
ncbi:MAG: hypothetical protein SXA11_18165 [Cyanobacteriota bacterium]|nr:hypothetical protein [Cyanobacteriota bacterium]